jgi:hypothetical protein
MDCANKHDGIIKNKIQHKINNKTCFSISTKNYRRKYIHLRIVMAKSCG